MVEFGERLRSAREEKGMTQQTLAEELYVTRQSVSHWECGDRYPDLLTTKRISDILDVSLDDLLSGKEMNKVVERSPVIENKIANNVMIFFYAVLIFSFLAVMSWSVLTQDWKYLINWAAKCNDPLSIVNIVVVILGGIVRVAIFTYGLIQSINGNLSPKKIGLIMVAYYASFIFEFTEDLINVYGPRTECSFVSLFCHLPEVIGAVSAFVYFIRKNNKVIWPGLLLGASIWKVIETVKNSVIYISYVIERYTEENQFHDGLTFQRKLYIYRSLLIMVSELLICGLIIYQVIVLYRKRKIAADIAEETNASF
ncbi:MAG: helix-turn-helix transcriptional regulator [Butyrivibrio sp.]|nr:helix-turn-helix transcriptional regulator [Butyrivibrio sp.]